MPRPVRSSPLAALGALLALLAISTLAQEERAPQLERPPAASRRLATAGPMDVNHASAAELETLPRVGPALAARIVARREERGPFTDLAQLDEVPGIGPAVLEALRGRITFSTPGSDGLGALPAGEGAR
ncbi:MAG: helix-hairpin-helix domain-containing protein [Sandaracinus sp.]